MRNVSDGWIPDGNGRRTFVTEIVGNPNRNPSHGPTITGSQTIGETLTADTSTIRDGNGVPSLATNPSSFAYQWYRTDADGLNAEIIPGATSGTYTPTEDDRGKRLRVQVKYTDDDCYEQAIAAVADNTFASGLTMGGTAQVGETLTAETDGIADADGLSSPSFTYRWTRVDADGTSNPEEISGATSRTYTPVEDDRGKRVRVTVRFRDLRGHQEVLVALSETVAESDEPVVVFDSDRSYALVTRYRLTTTVNLAEYLADGVESSAVTFSVDDCGATRSDYYDSVTLSDGTLSLASNELGHTHGSNTQAATECVVTGATGEGSERRTFSFRIVPPRQLKHPPEVSVTGRYENALEVRVREPVSGSSWLRLAWRKSGASAWAHRIMSGAQLGSANPPAIRIAGLDSNATYTVRAAALKREAFDHYAQGRTIPERTLTRLASGLDPKWIRNLSEGGQSPSAAAEGTTTSGGPVFLRASVNGRALTVTMNEALDESAVPAASAFAVSGGHAVNAVAVNGSAVTLTLTSAVGADERVTVSYAVPGSGSVLQDEDETGAAAFSGQPVANETPTVTLILTPPSIGENGGTSTVTATLDKPSPQPTTVTVTAVAVSPATASDYTLNGSRLTIAANSLTSTGSVTITATDNDEDAPNKTVTVSGAATNGQGVTGPDAATLTITDDDVSTTLALSIGDARATEGDAGDAPLEFTVTLTPETTVPVTVDWQTSDGTATAGTDYTMGTGSLTFAPGEGVKTVTVQATGDDLDEPNETFTVTLSNVYVLSTSTKVVVEDGTGTGTIVDDDLPVVTVASDGDVTEGEDARFTLTRSSADVAETLAVTFEVTGGDSVLDGNAPTAATFPARSTMVTVTVATTDDRTDEPDATLTLALIDGDAYDLGASARAEARVSDNDLPLERAGALTLNVPSKAVRYHAGDAVDLILPAANGGTGPYAYTLEPLPAGLSFDGSARRLSGTPTAPGLTRVTYGARDAADPPATATRTFNLRIKKPKLGQSPLALNLSAKVMRYGAGEAVDLILPAANGGTGPYVYTLGPLPAGLSFDGGARRLSGTPTAPGATRMTYSVMDAADPPAAVTRTFNLRVRKPKSGQATLSLLAPANLVYEVGDTVDLTLPAASGGTGPYVYALDPRPAGMAANAYIGISLPAGLSFDGNTRRLSGTPIARWFTELVYSVSDAAGSHANATRIFNMRVRAKRSQSMTLSASSEFGYEIGDTVDLTLPAATGGTGPYVYALAPLPAGLSFDGNTRALSGTPTAPGITRMTYSARDAADPPVTITRSMKMRIDGPVVTIAAEADGITEGGDAVFVLTRTGDASAPLEVTVDVGEAGSVLSGAAPTAAMFGENETETRLRIATENDSTAEADGRVTATVSEGDGYAVAANAGSAAVDVFDDDEPGSPTGTAELAVADARVNESAGTPLAFQVTLSEERSSAVSVRYVTSNGSATAGADYVAASGMVRFEAGETMKTVNVAVLEDAHDEGEETMTLTLSRPFGARILDGTATGTIVNADAMPGAWLGRFGRTVAGQVLDAVEARMTAARRSGAEVSVAGRRLGAAEARDAVASRGAGAAGETDLAELLTVTGNEFLTGTSFALTDRTAEGGFGALWGRGMVTGFDGRDGALSVDGEVRTGLLGADWMRDDWTAGLIVSHSRGEGDYGGQGAGKVSSSLTGFYPWAWRALNERVTAWGVAGYGEGTLKLEPEGAARIETDMDLAMAAAGLRGVLVDASAEGGFELAAKTDGLFVRTTSDAARGGDGGMLEAADADVTRLRLGLEGTRTFRQEGGGTVTPSFGLAVRHDGGDAETGFGVDVGAGVAYADPSSGVTADLQGRGLLAHEASGFREVGLSGSLAFDPTPSSGRGPSLSLNQTAGASATGGVDALYGRETMAGLAADGGTGTEDLFGRRSLEVRVGYGFPAFGGRFTGTPELGFRVWESGRDYSLGWRLTPEGRNAGAFDLRLEATRREAENGDAPEHGAGLRATMRW